MSEQIETTEALDALPVGSVIRIDTGQAFSKVDDQGADWQAIGDPVNWNARGVLSETDGPATVLFRPDAPTPTPAESRALRDGALVAGVRETGCAVEIGGVRIHPCDEYGNDLTRPTPAEDDAVADAARDLVTAIERVGEFRRYWPREMRSEARAVESALDRLATLGIGADR